MREQNDRLFGMVDHLRGKAGLIVLDQRDFIFARYIGGRDDREFAPRNAFAESDPADVPPRDAAAHGHAVQHIRKGEVVHVAGATGHFFASLFADDGMSETFFFHILPRYIAILGMETLHPPAIPDIQYLIRSSFRAHSRNGSSPASRIIGSNGILRSRCRRFNSS